MPHLSNLSRTDAGSAEDHPLKPYALLPAHFEDQTSTADFDIVGVRSQAKHPTRSGLSTP